MSHAHSIRNPDGCLRQVNKLILVVGSVIACVFSSVLQAEDSDALLSKQSSIQMFSMSEAQWIANVQAIKAKGLGDYKIASTGEYTVYIRPDPSAGLLAIAPSYSQSEKTRPWKLSVAIAADTPTSASIYEVMGEVDVAKLMRTAMEDLAPEFSVMGYMIRYGREPATIHFSIYERNRFPPIDSLNDIGRVCPTRDGQETCVRTSTLE